MTEQEQRDMAQRLAEDSDVFDFDLALEVVRRRPVKAEEILRYREKIQRFQEEAARLRERRRLALREDFG